MSTPHSSSWQVRLSLFTALFAGIATPLRASGVAPHQAALALALVSALALLFHDPRVRSRFQSALLSPLGWGAMGVFAAWGLTATFSPDVVGSLKMAGRSAVFLLACVVIWAALAEYVRTHRLLWKTVVAASVAMAATVVLALLGIPYLGQILGGTFSHELHPILQFKAFAAAAMCLIPVVAWAGRRLGDPWRWWGYAYIPLALAVMFLTYNRAALAGFLAMAASGGLLLALAQHRYAKALMTTTFVCGAGIIAWIATRESRQFETLPTHDSVQTYLPYWLLDPHRQHIWKFAFERFLDHPWVGNGIDQLNTLPGAYLPVIGLDDSAATVPSHPHNWLLEILAETGMIGFVPTIVVLGLTAFVIVRRYLRDKNDGDFALLVLMAGFWCSALFNFSIWAVWWQLTFFMLFAIVAAARTSAPEADPPR